MAFRWKKEIKVMSDPEEESIRKVFSSHLIRHKIFASVLWYKEADNLEDAEGQPCIYLRKPAVLNLRLVCKSWLWSVNFLLRKYRTPLFKLNLTFNFPQDYPTHCLLACLKSFNGNDAIFADEENSFCQFPPFSLHIYSTFFREDKASLTKRFLDHFGKGLVKLSLYIVCGDDSINQLLRLPPQISFPILDRVSIQLCRLGQNNGPMSIDPSLSFLQDIIQSSKSTLQIFSLNGCLAPYFTDDFVRKIIIPATFVSRHPNGTRFHLDCSVNQRFALERLIILSANDPSRFLNLTVLKLYALSVPFETELLFRILTGIRDTVIVLQLQGDCDTGLGIPVRERSYLSVPQNMVRLKMVKIQSNEWYPCVTGPSSFQLWQPPLTLDTVIFTEITEHLFNQWTEQKEIYAGIKTVKLRLLQTNWRKRTLALTQDKMQVIHQTFPNVVHLTVSMIGTEACGVKYIFREMRNLQSLEISLAIGYPDSVEDVDAAFENRHYFEHSEHWDGLLIGATSSRLIKELNDKKKWSQDNPEEGLINTGRLSKEESVRNLVHLKSLCLVTGEYQVYQTGTRPCLISELAFEWGFKRMPELKQLDLCGNFRTDPSVFALMEKFHENKNLSSEYQSRARRKDMTLKEFRIPGSAEFMFIFRAFLICVFIPYIIITAFTDVLAHY